MQRMRTTSPHHLDVFGSLPSLLIRELDSEPVAQVLDELIAAGWRAGQLRHRVGAEPAQGSVGRDAAHVLELLRGLCAQPCPDVLHAREVETRERARRWEQETAPPPASAQVREASLAQIRAGLRGRPRRRPAVQPRTRAGCSLCDGEGAFFVTREVHLCRRCVDVLSTGAARLRDTG